MKSNLLKELRKSKEIDYLWQMFLEKRITEEEFNYLAKGVEKDNDRKRN